MRRSARSSRRRSGERGRRTRERAGTEAMAIGRSYRSPRGATEFPCRDVHALRGEERTTPAVAATQAKRGLNGAEESVEESLPPPRAVGASRPLPPRPPPTPP